MSIYSNNQKIPAEWENPVDHCLLDNLGGPIGNFLYKLHFTPNMITSLGVLFRIISVYALWHGNKPVFLLGAIVGYFFDCLDGNYARKYNMCSQMGDVYDHTSDVIYHLIIVYYLLYKSDFRKSPYFRVISIGLIILLFFMLMHFGCQECFYEHGTVCYSPTLSIFKNLCHSVDYLPITRFFGSGTVLPVIYLLVFFY